MQIEQVRIQSEKYRFWIVFPYFLSEKHCVAGIGCHDSNETKLVAGDRRK
jgi:hypothetical protein